ncbi:helix-turn-helix domain-containing protein [Rhodococcus sp. NPDC003318]|uniref:AraC-like ligand-binding domain-containing protein n=1 Tax=Rhodococcus sp. NPDC003318 TaxID=3364503 RepID=UPI0036767318
MGDRNLGAVSRRFDGGITMTGSAGIGTLSGMCRFRSDDPDNFAATMISVDLGSVRVNRLRSTAVIGIREQDQIGDVMSGYLAVACVRSGSVVLEQNRGLHTVRAGDVVCVDFGRGLVLDIAEDTELVFVYLPRAAVLARFFDPGRLAGAVLSNSVVGAALAGVLDPLTTAGAAVDDVALVEHAVVDLALAVLREVCPVDATPDATGGLRSRVYEYIERHFTDPTLSVERVAAGVNVSTRYLHKLMEPELESVYGLIRRRRVRCGIDLLGDPACSELSIGQIARRSGFAGLSQFGRAVRDLTGQAPREIRRRSFGRP